MNKRLCSILLLVKGRCGLCK